MNKSQLISAISAKAGISKVDSQKAIEAFMEVTKETLVKGDKVTLVGFGTFNVTKKAAHKGRNPRTGAVISIPAKKVAKFKFGNAFTESL